MKKIYFNLLLMLIALVSVTGCQKADPEFDHDNNLISDMRVKMTPAAEGIAGVITEYNAAGEVVPAGEGLTAKAVQGGYGTVEFILKRSLIGAYDLERCYLSASLTFDEIITLRWHCTTSPTAMPTVWPRESRLPCARVSELPASTK